MQTKTKVLIAAIAVLIVSGAIAVFVFLMWRNTVLPAGSFFENQIETHEGTFLNMERRGNSTGNITNAGLVAQEGTWIYYVATEIFEDGFFEPQLIRARTDGSGREVLFVDTASTILSLNVIDDWIYFVARHNDIYRIRTDGTQLERIGSRGERNINSARVAVVDDWLYFECIDSRRLYKRRRDGGRRERIVDMSAGSMNVAYGWVFFVDRDSFSIFKVRPDGTELTRLNDTQSGLFIVYGDWVYYTNREKNFAVYRMRIDGSEHQNVIPDGGRDFNVFEGWVYYANGNSENRLYRIRVDGTDMQRISEYPVFDIHIINEWIYYKEGTRQQLSHLEAATAPLYRMRADGTGRERVY